MSQYFSKSFWRKSFGGNINVKVDLSNYARTDLESVTCIDTLSVALKANLISLKTEVFKLDIDKLPPVSVDFSKLSDVVEKDVVKETVYDELVVKVNNINTSDSVWKFKNQTGKTELEKKIPDETDFIKKIKLTELATKTALTAVENRIPNVSSLVRNKL